MLETEVHVHTPEQVALKFRTAGIGSRAIAQLLDLCLLFVVYALLGLSLLAWNWLHLFGRSLAWVVGLAIVATFVVFWAYFIATEYFLSGKTVGKWLCRLRVVQRDGRPVTFYGAVLRNLFRLIDGLPGGYLIGVICMMLDKHERRIGDLVAGTVVVLDQSLARLRPSASWEATQSTPSTEAALLRLEVSELPGCVLIIQEVPETFRSMMREFVQRKGMTRAVQERIGRSLWQEFLRLPGVRVEKTDASVQDVVPIAPNALPQVFRKLERALRQQERSVKFR